MKGPVKWKLWHLVSKKLIKQHYMRFVCAIVASEEMADFRELNLHVLTIALSEMLGLREDGSLTQAEDSKTFLVNKVVRMKSPELPDISEKKT